MFTVSIRVYEMGEDTFVETRHETLAEALAAASANIAKFCVNDDSVTEWAIVDPTGSADNLHLEVQWTCTVDADTDDAYSEDYIMQVYGDDD